MRPTLLLLLPITLGGCKLIDQTTFGPAPEVPAPSRLAALPPVQDRVALLTIRYSTPSPDYRDALRTAVGIAEERRPGTAYDVVAVVPAPQDPAQVNRELAQARQNAAAVMRSIMALGVADTRIGLAARTQPGLATREVRVYVR